MFGPTIIKRPTAPLVIGPPVGSYQYPWSGILGTGTLAVTANRLYGVLFAVGQPTTVDRVGFEITTGVAGNCRVGAYNFNPTTGLPSTLISDCGVGDTTNIAVVEITSSFIAPAGFFFLACVFDATPTVRRMSASVPVVGVPWGHSANNETGSNASNQHVVYGAHTYGALPAAFPAATYASSSHLPKLHLRRG